jgi:hypothetical protein
MHPSVALPPEHAAALADEASQQLREQVALETARYLADNGSRLRFHHWLDNDRAGHAFGIITGIAAELVAGAAALVHAENFYAASALTRQLLECGYLLDAAAQSPDELARWHRGDPLDLRNEFTPVKLRRRSSTGFRDGEYRAHCENGGHPHPRGAHLLRPVSKELAQGLWADLALHAAETWELFCAALLHYDSRARGGDVLYSPDRSPEGRYEVAILLREWRTVDSLAHRSGPPIAT